MNKSKSARISIPVLALAVVMLASLACGDTTTGELQEAAEQPTATTEPTSVATSEAEPAPTLPPEPAATPWVFSLSKVLTYEEAEEYLFGLITDSFFYDFSPQDGWHTVVVEIAVRSRDWAQVNGCPFLVTVIDSGGFERFAKVGIGISECYARVRLPPDGQMKIVAFTEIPNNQKPEKIIINHDSGSSQLDVSDARPVSFSTTYNFPEWPTAPSEATLEIPNTARIIFNFAGAYFVDSRPYGYGMHPDESTGTQLFIPIRVENIGGFNLDMGNPYKYNWNTTVQVDGLDSEGNVSTATNVWIMRQMQDTSCCPPIPPGQTAEYDLRLSIWPASTAKIEWIWFGINLSDGDSIVSQFQFAVDKPNALGTYSPGNPTSPTGIEWFNQPPPSQQP